MECTKDHIFAYGTNEDRCKFVLANDDCNGESVIDFFDLYFCQMSESIGGSIPLGIVLLYILFYLLSRTAEKFLSPAITQLSEMCKMSENLAGVTFLALANGAPDVLASMAAANNEASGIELSIGGLVGACIFIAGLCLSFVALVSPSPIKMPKSKFLRDLIFLIISLIILSAFAFSGSITLWMAILYFLLYFAYLAYVIWEDRRRKKVVVMDDDMLGIELDSGDDFDLPDELSLTMNAVNYLEDEYTDDLKIARHEEDTIVSINTKYVNPNNISTSLLDDYMDTIEEGMDHNPYEEEAFDFSRNRPVRSQSFIVRKLKRARGSANWSMFKMKMWLKHNLVSEEWEDMNLFWKINYVLFDVPIDFLGKLTIPPYSKETWDRRWATISPICAILFIFFVFELYPKVFFKHGYVILFVLPFSFALSFAIYCNTYRNRAPSVLWIYTVGAFFMSICWIWLIANLLVDIISLFGLLAAIDATYLGITFIAIGASLGDTFAVIAISKMGYSEMAITGTIAAPLFNLLVGLGISLIQVNVHTGPPRFNIHSKKSILPLTVIFTNVVWLLIVLALFLATRFTLRKWVAYWGFIFYGIFLVGVTILAFTAV